MDSIQLISSESGSRDVLLLFSARAVERGKFTFWKLAQRLPVNVILINDYSNGWYLKGTPEFSSESEFLDFLTARIAHITQGTGRLFCMGSSMGAYATLKYGALLHADKMLAMGPESELCLPLGRSVSTVKGVSAGTCDISGMPYKEGAEILIFSGNNDIVDFYCACRFKEKTENARIVLINNETHVVAKYLEREFGLVNVAQDFFLNNDTDFLARIEAGPVPDAETARDVRLFNEELTKKNVAMEYRTSIEKVAAAAPRWSMIQYFLGMIRCQDRDLEAANAAFELALMSQPDLGRARLKLAQNKMQQRLYAEAVEHLDYLAQKNLTLNVAKLLHQSLIMLGKKGRAIGILEEALALDMTLDQKAELRKKILDIAESMVRDYAAASSVI